MNGGLRGVFTDEHEGEPGPLGHGDAQGGEAPGVELDGGGAGGEAGLGQRLGGVGDDAEVSGELVEAIEGQAGGLGDGEAALVDDEGAGGAGLADGPGEEAGPDLGADGAVLAALGPG
ncbi:MAG: hypothetical protein MUF64_07855 [Polyangiaceae bacterium]|nr:hypothetical protein [Polyangiaceae bacterium]